MKAVLAVPLIVGASAALMTGAPSPASAITVYPTTLAVGAVTQSTSLANVIVTVLPTCASPSFSASSFTASFSLNGNVTGSIPATGPQIPNGPGSVAFNLPFGTFFPVGTTQNAVVASFPAQAGCGAATATGAVVAHASPVLPGFNSTHFTAAGGAGNDDDAPTPTQLANGGCDDCSQNVALPFPINFYGNTYSSLWIDNNGFVSFGAQPFGAYGATGFPQPPGADVVSQPNGPMIAPFWADIDTRNYSCSDPVTHQSEGVASWGSGTFEGQPAWGVTWPRVGLATTPDPGLSGCGSGLDTFQVIFVSEPMRGAGSVEVYFNYGSLQWSQNSAADNGYQASGYTGYAGAGFDAGDGAHYVNTPGSLTSAIQNSSLMSNMIPPEPGRSAFRVDQTGIAGVIASGTQVYGGSPSYSITLNDPTQPGVTVAGTLWCGAIAGGTPITPSLPVGTYSIDPNSCSGLSNTAGSTGLLVDAGLTVTPAPLPVGVTGSQSYDGTAAFSANTSAVPAGTTPAGTPTCTGLVGGTPITPTLAPGTYQIDPSTCSGVSLSTANYVSSCTYQVDPSACPGTATSNYSVSYVGRTFTVTPGTVDVTVSGAQAYGSSPVFTTISGSLPPGQSVLGTPTCTSEGGTAISSTLAPGSYTIDGSSCSGLSLSHPEDDSLVVVGGALSVSPANVDVPVSGAQTYGGTPSFNGGTGSLPTGVTLSGTPTCTSLTGSTPISSSLDAGSYAIDPSTCSGLTLSDAVDYTLVLTDGGFTISPADTEATITGSQTYGGSPSFTVTTGVLPSGTALSGTVTCSGVAGGQAISSALSAGSYSIDPTTCSGLSLSGTDHRLVLTGGTFVVAPASVEVTVSASAVYGGAPSFDVATASVPVNGTPTCTALADGTSISPSLSVGSYSIDPSSCSGLTLTDSVDYTLVLLDGGLTVTPQPISVIVSGTQGSGGSPLFSTAGSLPSGITLDGAVTCSALVGGTPLSASLPAGSYTLDASSCSGLSPSDSLDYSVQFENGPYAVLSSVATALHVGGPTSLVTGEGDALVATVTPSIGGMPSSGGSVTFKVTRSAGKGAVACTGGDVAAVTGFSATCQIAASLVRASNGDLLVTASYSGSGALQPSSATLDQPVAPDATTVSVVTPVALPVSGTNKLLVRVTAAAPGSGTPTGTVTLQVAGANPAGPQTSCAGGPTLTLLGGRATCVLASPLVASQSPYSVTADYGGAPDYLSSGADPSVAVAKAASTLALSSSPSAPVSTSAVTVTATVSNALAKAGGAPRIGEVVSFTLSKAKSAPVSCTGGSLQSLDTDWIATCQLAAGALSAGTWSVTATYAGDADVRGATKSLKLLVS